MNRTIIILIMLLLAVITNAQLTYFDADYYKNASKT